MSRGEQDLKFPFLRDNTRLIEYQNLLYKVRVRYDQESFKGRKVLFTIQDLSTDIEQTLRAVMYMYENRIKLQPIETQFFLILPYISKWSFPSKYPNYAFKRGNRVIEMSDYMFELRVQHVDVLTVEGNMDIPSVDRVPNDHETSQGEGGSCSNKVENDKRISSASRFIRDSRGRLCRQVNDSNGQNQINTVQGKQSNQNKSVQSHQNKSVQSHQNKSVQGKQSNQNNTVQGKQSNQNNTVQGKLSNQNNTVQEKLSNKNNSQTLENIRVTVKRTSEKTLDNSKGNKQIPSKSSKEISCTQTQQKMSSEKEQHNNCVECLEEQLYRRRSSRLKQVTQDGKKSNLEHLPQPDKPLMSNMKSLEIHGENERNHSLRLSPGNTRKRNAAGLNRKTSLDRNNPHEPKKCKTDGLSPISVYRDILQKRNKDRHKVQQIESGETTKLEELYEVTTQRRSERQASKSEGRLSGLWNFVGSFFTPKK